MCDGDDQVNTLIIDEEKIDGVFTLKLQFQIVL